MGGSAFAVAPFEEVGFFAAQEVGEHHAVNFAGAINQASLAGVAVDPFDRGVLGIAFGAHELQGGVGGFVQGVGDNSTSPAVGKGAPVEIKIPPVMLIPLPNIIAILLSFYLFISLLVC